MWDLFSIRKMAIEELLKFTMDPVTRTILARQYSVQKLLFAGYEELAERTEPISIGEAEQLGWDTAILIFHIREESYRGYCSCAEGIRRVFAKELKDVEEPEVSASGVAVPE
jgi:hypothetical protein